MHIIYKMIISNIKIIYSMQPVWSSTPKKTHDQPIFFIQVAQKFGDDKMKTKYCLNCERVVTPTSRVSIWVFLFLLIWFIFPGFFYLVWAYAKGGRCPICNGKNFVSQAKAETLRAKQLSNTYK